MAGIIMRPQPVSSVAGWAPSQAAGSLAASLAAAADFDGAGVDLGRERAAGIARRAAAADADGAELLALVGAEAEADAGVAGRALRRVGRAVGRAALALRSRRDRRPEAI